VVRVISNAGERHFELTANFKISKKGIRRSTLFFIDILKLSFDHSKVSEKVQRLTSQGENNFITGTKFRAFSTDK